MSLHSFLSRIYLQTLSSKVLAIVIAPSISVDFRSNAFCHASLICSESTIVNISNIPLFVDAITSVSSKVRRGLNSV